MSAEYHYNNLFVEAKISIPSKPSNIIHRQRLIEELEEAFDKKLIFISAMSGYGKTTFLSSWFNQEENNRRQAAWLSLDDADNDPVRFLRYLIYSLQKIDPILGKTTLKELENGQIPDFPAGLSSFIAEINQTKIGFWIVLDDIHVIENPVIWKGLFDLVQWLQPGIKIVFAGRNSLPDSFSIFRVRNAILEINASDLRFTLQEVRDFFEEETGKILPETTLLDLDKRFQGWAAGLQLAILVFKKNKFSFDVLYHFNGSHPFFYQFLFEEVLNGLSDSNRDFLLLVSPLSVFCVDLCHYLDPSLDMEKIIPALKNNDLLLQIDNNQGEWFSLHPLMADALKRHLNHHSPGRSGEILLKAMKWHSQNGNVNQAIEYGIKGEYWEDVIKLLTAIPFSELIREHQWATIIRWIESLPHEIRENSPLLVVRLAFSQMLMGNFLFTSEFINRFKISFLNEEIEPTIEFYNAFAFALSNTDEVQLMVDFAMLALKNTSYSNLPQYGVAKTLLAAGLVGKGNILEAEKILLEIFPLKNKIDFPDLIYFAMKMQALVHLHRGELSSAKDIFDEIKNDCLNSSNSSIGHLVDSYTYAGKIFFEWDDLESSKKCFIEGLDICEREFNDLYKTIPLAYLSRIDFIQGNSQKMLERLNELENISRKIYSEAMRRRLSAYVTWLNLLNGELVLSENWLLQVRDNFSSGNLTDRNLEKRVAVRVYLKLGDFDCAENLLQDLVSEAKESGKNGDLVEILVLYSLLDQARGNVYKAVKTIRKALKLGIPGRYTRVFLDEGQPMLELLKRAYQGAERGEKVLGLIHSLDRNFRAHESEFSSTYSYSINNDQIILNDQLSSREVDVLKLASKGYSNKEIADQLSISAGTAKLHMHNICQKLNVQNRHQAGAKALSLGIIHQ